MIWEPDTNYQNGEYCAARQLNAAANNLSLLHSWVTLPNMPFGGEECTHTVDDASQWKNAWLGYIRHKANTLHVNIQIKCKLDRIGYVELLYNNVVIGSAQATNEWVAMSSPIDLSALGLIVDNFYPLQVRHKSSQDYYETQCRVYYIYETDISLPDNTGTWRTPDTWAHLDPGRGSTLAEYPQFYTFSQDLLWLKGHLHSANWGVRKIGFQANKIDGGFYSYGIVHRMRWLHHLGSGEITDSHNSYSFKDAMPGAPMTIWGIVDLDSLNWMMYGRLYYIQTERTPGENPDREWEDSTYELACAFEDMEL